MSLRNDKKVIYELLEEYKQKYYDIPSLNSVEYITGEIDAYAEFRAEDLYNQKYILYIHPDLFSMGNKEMRDKLPKQIIFHEFTHIYDSLSLLNYDLLSFKKIMCSYSEIHAREIENRELILTQKPPYNLYKTVVGVKGRKTLEEYVDKSIGELCNQFMPINKIITPETNIYDYRELYAIVGKLRALRYSNIEYDHTFINMITKPFIDIINEIIKYGFDLNVKDANIFMELQDKLIDSINAEKEHHNKIYRLLNE
nr:hypothetical protein [uncultured Lachnoclostridium sp.]